MAPIKKLTFLPDLWHHDIHDNDSHSNWHSDRERAREMIRISIAVWVFCILPSLPASAFESDYKPYIQCLEEQEAKDVDSCLDKAERSEWSSFKSSYGCLVNKQILEFADRNKAKLSWEVFFMNEHCRRLDEPFYKRTKQRE